MLESTGPLFYMLLEFKQDLGFCMWSLGLQGAEIYVLKLHGPQKGSNRKKTWGLGFKANLWGSAYQSLHRPPISLKDKLTYRPPQVRARFLFRVYRV